MRSAQDVSVEFSFVLDFLGGAYKLLVSYWTRMFTDWRIVVKTPMSAQAYENKEIRDALSAMIPWGDWGLADEVAKCAVFLASDDAAYMTGVPLVIDGGYTAQ